MVKHESADSPIDYISGVITFLGVEAVGLAAVLASETWYGRVGGALLMAGGIAVGAKELGNSQASE
jgi:hypothetical protein